MSQSPETTTGGKVQDDYLAAFGELAQRIRDGASFSGRERHCAYLNIGGKRFADVSAISGFGYPDDGRGMALTDWDHDGDLDVWLSNRSAPRLRFLQNSLPASGNQWVAFRLEGDPAQQCPRDAIGSQVELIADNASGLRRVKTLHAGNGLMSQSSKWIHFGLGSEPSFSGVRVRWAGGMTEEFPNPQAGQRWLLKQGTGRAVAAQEPRPSTLPPAPLALPQPTEVARIRLSQPLKIPDLTYEDFSGTRRSITALTGEGAVLVNLWATWCAPCAAELKSFASARDQFAAEGIQVVALNVDHLAEDSALSPSQAARALQGFGYEGAGGMADAVLIDLLEQSILKSVYRHHSMPVPVSFLIDTGGWLSAIYKGPVTVNQIIADRKLLGRGPEEAKAAAVPFAGTWSRDRFPSNPMAIAGAYLEGEYLEDARRVLDDYLEENAAPPGDPSVPAALQLNRQLGGVYYQLGDIALREGQPGEARDFLLTSLTYNQRQIPALNKLAWLLATSSDPAVRDGQAALKHATFMMQAPGVASNPALLATLGAAHAAAGNFPEAIKVTRRAVALFTGRGLEEKAQIQRQHLEQYDQGKALSL